jgi:hypothetical protein
LPEKKVVDFKILNNKIGGVIAADGTVFNADDYIVATGHSARDIFELLHQKNILIEAKPFALGVRVEHPQSLIDQIQYHCESRGDNLPPASYSLVEQVNEKESAYEPSNDAITTDTLAGRMPGGKFNSFKSFKTRVSPLSKDSGQKPGDDTPEIIQPQDTPARKSHEVKEATIAGLSGFKRIKKDVADKSGAVHTPMSRAKDLAQQALKTVQNKTKVK